MLSYLFSPGSASQHRKILRSSKKGWEIKASIPSRPNRFGTPNAAKKTQYYYITNVLSRNAEILRLCLSPLSPFFISNISLLRPRKLTGIKQNCKGKIWKSVFVWKGISWKWTCYACRSSVAFITSHAPCQCAEAVGESIHMLLRTSDCRLSLRIGTCRMATGKLF